MPSNNSKARKEQRRKDAEERAVNPDLEGRKERELRYPGRT